jgi:hypothetical protein
MEPKITIKEHYILLEPQQAELWEILESLATLFKLPEFPHKHTIWNFSAGPLKLTYDYLYKLRDFIKKNEPKQIKPNKKIAIVASTGLFSALVTEYSKIVKDFPIEIQVFSDLNTAERWIAGK